MDDYNYYVYILSNAQKNVIYTGITNDLVRRVMNIKITWTKVALPQDTM